LAVRAADDHEPDRRAADAAAAYYVFKRYTVSGLTAGMTTL
jgi:hypothetical protein